MPRPDLVGLLDSAIQPPGSYRIGLDRLIGLVKGLLDVAARLLSACAVGEAGHFGGLASASLGRHRR